MLASAAILAFSPKLASGSVELNPVLTSSSLHYLAVMRFRVLADAWIVPAAVETSLERRGHCSWWPLTTRSVCN